MNDLKLRCKILLPSFQLEAISFCEFTCNQLVALVIESDPFDPDALLFLA